KIGDVRRVHLDNDTGKVHVSIRVEPEYGLRRGDQPVLVQGLLSGDTAIDFMPRRGVRDPDPTPVPPGSILEGVVKADVGTLVNHASELVPPTHETFDEARKVLARLEQLAPVMEETLRAYRDVAVAAQKMVPELGRTNDEVRELVKATRAVLPGLERTNA